MRGHSETERHTPGETEAKSWKERPVGSPVCARQAERWSECGA